MKCKYCEVEQNESLQGYKKHKSNCKMFSCSICGGDTRKQNPTGECDHFSVKKPKKPCKHLTDPNFTNWAVYEWKKTTRMHPLPKNIPDNMKMKIDSAKDLKIKVLLPEQYDNIQIATKVYCQHCLTIKDI